MSLDLDVLIPALRAHLFEWLPRQRWFDAFESELDDITVIRTEVLRPAAGAAAWPLTLWVPLEVVIAGLPWLCQTVLALAPSVPDDVPDRSILGEVPAGERGVMAYDALFDPVAAATFLEHIAGELSPGTVSAVDDGPWVTVIDAAPNLEVTMYRRVEAGAHPDVELTSVVAGAGGTMVRPPAVVWRRNAHDLATVRRGVRRGTDGSTLARASIDELLSRRCQPRENPLDVLDAFTELGRAVAEMHTRLAEGLGITDPDGASLAAMLAERLPRHLDEVATQRVTVAYRRLAGADDLGSFIRVHGNTGLDTIERVRQTWILSRFGCAPESAMAFEQQPQSPLADLAGILHDLGLVATGALRRAVAERDATLDGAPPDFYEQAERREIALLCEAWEERAADALIAGYTSEDAVHRLLPVERSSRDALLTLFELELSVRDVARAAGRGPELLRIPVEEVEGLTEASIRLRW